MRRAVALARACEAPALLEVVVVPLLAALSQPPRTRGAAAVAAVSDLDPPPAYIEVDDGGLLIFPVFVMSEGGFGLDRPKSSSANVALGN